MIRFLIFILALAVAPSAQPLAFTEAASGLPSESGDPERAPEDERSRDNVVAIEAGGASFGLGIRYERNLGRRVRAGIGYSQFTVGDIFAESVRMVPVSAAYVYPLSRRWALDGGVSGGVALSSTEEGTYTVPGSDFTISSEGDDRLVLVLPMPTVGARYEAGALHARVGLRTNSASFDDQFFGIPFFPLPSASAGIRF